MGTAYSKSMQSRTSTNELMAVRCVCCKHSMCLRVRARADYRQRSCWPSSSFSALRRSISGGGAAAPSGSSAM